MIDLSEAPRPKDGASFSPLKGEPACPTGSGGAVSRFQTLLQIKPQLIFVSSLSFLLPRDVLADHLLLHPNCIHRVSLSPEVVSVVRPPAKMLVLLENPYRPLLTNPKNRYRAQRTQFSQAPINTLTLEVRSTYAYGQMRKYVWIRCETVATPWAGSGEIVVA